MRWLFLLLTFATSAFGAGVDFVRVWPQWRDADAFDRIGEYFGRGENDGRERVLRTHGDQRAGLYFLVRVKSDRALAGAKFVLQIIRPDSPDPKTFTFPASLPAQSKIVELGLTDGDWPGGRDAHPVAWKLTLVDATGSTVATNESFLWALPAK